MSTGSVSFSILLYVSPVCKHPQTYNSPLLNYAPDEFYSAKTLTMFKDEKYLICVDSDLKST